MTSVTITGSQGEKILKVIHRKNGKVEILQGDSSEFMTGTKISEFLSGTRITVRGDGRVKLQELVTE